MPVGQPAPEPWAAAMLRVGAVSPRTGLPSMRQLAEMSGIHATTIQRIVDKRVGPQGASPETIQRLANALQVRESEVAKWAGQNWNGNGPYVPPKEADLLGPRQRKALNEIIKAMAELQRAIPTSGQAA